jgi:protein PhnA
MGSLLVCPECAHEWSSEVGENETAPDTQVVVRDSAGNVLQDGDTVTITKDLKVKGSATAIKVGTKVRNIRLISPRDGHDIDAKVDGFGSMYLKSSIVKKVL